MDDCIDSDVIGHSGEIREMERVDEEERDWRAKVVSSNVGKLRPRHHVEVCVQGEKASRWLCWGYSSVESSLKVEM